MSNLSEEERDLYIRKKISQDNNVSKKYNDMFEDFLRGDHEMNEKTKSETKEERKNIKRKWLKPFAAVAACTLVVTGANVYATTKGYDNIFFLIKDLRNKKDTTVVAEKNEILSDSDTTISYTKIEIADGLYIQINKFVVKDGKASLFVNIDQNKAKSIPDKFILTSNNIELANEQISENNQKVLGTNDSFISQYSYEIKLNNNYKNEMKLLNLKIVDKNSNEISTIEINLEKREIDLIGENEVKEEVEKISEVELKEKIGNYVVMIHPLNLTNEERMFFLGSNLLVSSNKEPTTTTENGYIYYSKNKLNSALNESIGKEIGTNINSEIFDYIRGIDGYQYMTAGDMSYSGLCLNIDDLKFEGGKYIVKFTYCMPSSTDYLEGTIEDLSRYQTTFEFSLNKNATYSKYKILNIETAVPKKIREQVVEDNKPSEVIDENPEHTHNYIIVENIGKHTTLDGTHTLRCTICGEEKQEKHHFDKWYTINNGTAWTLWCEDGCKQYIYTIDYNEVQNSGYGLREEIDNNTNTENQENLEVSNKPNYDPSKVDNYASTMDWTEYWAPGIKFQYPTEWDFSDNPRDTENGLMVNAEAKGWAIGKNPDTKEIIESYTIIEVYDQVIAYGDTIEEAYKQFALSYELEEKYGIYYTNNNGDEWHEFRVSGKNYDGIAGETYYVHLSGVSNGGNPSREYVVDIVRIATNNLNNFKVTNITNRVIGNLKLTSK